MVVTSAMANKLIRQFTEEKEYLLSMECERMTYDCAEGEESIIPEYDYRDTSEKVAQLDRKICTLKHALNVQNVSARIMVGDKEMSVDEILVKMSQLNRRKAILSGMRERMPKERLSLRYSASTKNQVPEYRYINYNLEDVKADYEKVDAEITKMQLALDMHNQIEQFEVEI